MIALIDESASQDRRGLHYVLAAVVLMEEHADEVLAEVSNVVGPRSRAFHWISEGVEKRSAMVGLIAGHALPVFATVHEPVRPKQQVLARTRSLLALVGGLEREGVHRLLIESRGIQDVADKRDLIDGQKDGRLTEGLSYEFGGKQDPRLWLPDAVAGLVAHAEVGGSQEWLLRLQGSCAALEIVRLDAQEPRLPF